MKKIKIAVILLVLLLLSSYSVQIIVKAAPSTDFSNYYCVLDGSTGRVIDERNSDKKVFPASTTKILTAMVAMDRLSDDLPITYISEAQKTPKGSSLSGFKLGDSFKKEDIIRGLLIPSGNDIGILIAVTVARRDTGDNGLSIEESIKYFSKLMNQKASEYGAKNSSFINPHGYHEDGHYTTPYDMAIISQHVKDYPLISNIVKEPFYVVNATDEAGLVTHTYKIKSHNEFLVSNRYGYEFATGIKTGYTPEAGYCLAASTDFQGRTLIISVFKTDSIEARSKAAIELAKVNYSKYKSKSLIYKKNKEPIIIMNSEEAKQYSLSYKYKEDINQMVSDEEYNKIQQKLIIDKNTITKVDNGYLLNRDIKAGDKIGKLELYLDNKLIGQTEVISTASLTERSIIKSITIYLFQDNYMLGNIILPVVILLILILYIRSLIRKRRSRKRRR